ncbi:hypothetical protein MBLNU459_g7187t1 [Dothideomycetes sp. NU459]
MRRADRPVNPPASKERRSVAWSVRDFLFARVLTAGDGAPDDDDDDNNNNNNNHQSRPNSLIPVRILEGGLLAGHTRRTRTQQSQSEALAQSCTHHTRPRIAVGPEALWPLRTRSTVCPRPDRVQAIYAKGIWPRGIGSLHRLRFRLARARTAGAARSIQAPTSTTRSGRAPGPPTSAAPAFTTPAMTAVLSPHSGPPSQPSSSHPSSQPSPTPNPRANAFPKLETSSPTPSTHSSAREHLARSRMSNYSQSRSRPTSAVFPIFHTSLTYALVRDFAYPAFHALHYGPPPDTSSGRSTPTSNYDDSNRRLSDPPSSWESAERGWSAGPWGGDGGARYEDSESAGDQLPSTSFSSPDSDDGGGGGGEPATAAKLAKNHRKSKSLYTDEYARGRRKSKGRASRSKPHQHQPQQPGLNSAGLFTSGGTDDDDSLPGTSYLSASPAATSPSPSLSLQPPFSDSSPRASGASQPDEHRPTSTSLDESYAGPSLALYTFVPENANELALREGQIIQVGYRHGQGWLVAMDLDTGEQGLVPEEYVRLLEDIEGWGEDEAEAESSADDETQQQQRPPLELGDEGSRDGGDREVRVKDVEDALGKAHEPGGKETMLPERNKTAS